MVTCLQCITVANTFELSSSGLLPLRRPASPTASTSTGRSLRWAEACTPRATPAGRCGVVATPRSGSQQHLPPGGLVRHRRHGRHRAVGHDGLSWSVV